MDSTHPIPGTGMPYERAQRQPPQPPQSPAEPEAQPPQRPQPPAEPEARAAKLRQRLLIGSRIRQARERLGLTQEQLASSVGVRRERVTDWESTRVARAPSALHVEQLAAALGEPIHYFYGGPSAHPLPFALDSDPYAQPVPDPAEVSAEIGELLALLDQAATRLRALGYRSTGRGADD